MVSDYYAEWEQTKDYRLAAWELGCVCPLLTPSHVHWRRCPMYETPAQVSERLEAEHLEDIH